MDLRKLKTLIDLVAESDISELEVTEGESKVRIVKASTAANQVVMMQQQPMAAHAQAAPLPAVAPTVSAVPAAEVAAEPTGHIVKSPMVGTFYRSPTPGADSFVKIGDTVKGLGDLPCALLGHACHDVSFRLMVALTAAQGRPSPMLWPL